MYQSVGMKYKIKADTILILLISRWGEAAAGEVWPEAAAGAAAARLGEDGRGGRNDAR